MKFKEYLQKVNEDANYNPEVFDDEINGKVPDPTSTDVSTPAPVEQKSAMGNLVAQYFSKGNADAIASLDGFSNDMVNELSSYIEKEWILCPYCHTKIKKKCVHCGNPIELPWNICPYCGEQQQKPFIDDKMP